MSEVARALQDKPIFDQFVLTRNTSIKIDEERPNFLISRLPSTGLDRTHTLHSQLPLLGFGKLPTAMAPIYPVRATTRRQAQNDISTTANSASSRRSPSKKSKVTRKSKSSSTPSPKAVLVTPSSLPEESSKPRLPVESAENSDPADAVEGRVAEHDTKPHVPDFTWPFQFPDRSQLVEVCIKRTVDTLCGRRGVLSLEYNSLLREETCKPPELLMKTLCNSVFAQTYSLLQRKQEAGAAISTVAELTKEIDLITDLMLPLHIKRFDLYADVRMMIAAEQLENVFEHLGADDCSITNVNFFKSPEVLEENNMGPQFIHEHLNPLRRGSSEVFF